MSLVTTQNLYRQAWPKKYGRTSAMLFIGMVLGSIGILSYQTLHKSVVEPSAALQSGVTPSTTPDLTSSISTTLTTAGFSPDQLNHDTDNFNLTVINQSGLPEIVLRLQKESGEKVTEARVTSKVRSWSSQFKLPAGHYTLMETKHPAWTCAITIQAN
jgi:hypothetical protein